MENVENSGVATRITQICSCLRGFEARNSQEWSKGNRSSGCVRRTPLQCGTLGGKQDGFLKLSNMKVPDNSDWVYADNEDHCKSQCLRNCSCLAYAYYFGTGCMVWNTSLIDIQEFSSAGVDLFVRLAHSELGKNLYIPLVKTILFSSVHLFRAEGRFGELSFRGYELPPSFPPQILIIVPITRIHWV